MRKEFLERWAYLHSESQYYDDLVVLEAERIVLEGLVGLKKVQGFRYQAPAVSPQMPVDKDGFLPPHLASFEDRWQLGLHRDIEVTKLEKQFGKGNVWIGPQVSDKPVYTDLSESEQRGLWVREIDDALGESLAS